MDPHSSAKDVHRCDLCKTAVVQSYCDFCHVNLCKPCIGEHISDGYHKHAIVAFNERGSTLIYPKCEAHQHKICEFQCASCNNIYVCSSCMTSEQHMGHVFVDISEVYDRKKEEIENDKQKIKKLIYPTCEEIAIDMEKQLVNLDEGYEKFTTIIFEQGEQWHREIDIVINKMKTEISEIKVTHRNILQKHLDEIKQTQHLIQKSLLALGELEKSTEVRPTIEYISKIRELSKLLPKVQISLPSFIPKPIDHEALNSLFGLITPLSTASEEHVLPLNQPNPVREQLDEPEPVAATRTSYKRLRRVTCQNNDRIMTSGETKL